jgi:acyl-CoA reductase-like NAD-dependent aldehyde dehydrogenase
MTAIDAYQLGYHVYIIEDAIASTEITHASLSIDYMSQRGIEFIKLNTFKDFINSPIPFKENNFLSHYDPTNHKNLIAKTLKDNSEKLSNYISELNSIKNQWRAISIVKRIKLLENFYKFFLESKEDCIDLIIKEVGKPRKFANDEYNFSKSLYGQAVKEAKQLIKYENSKENNSLRYLPLGIVAVITPFNNPLAIPIGKIIPAIAFGNVVLWKPAPESTLIAEFLKGLFVKAKIGHLLKLVIGDAAIVRQIAKNNNIDAITFTGSEKSGYQVASLALDKFKRIQLEMGGNNSIIVTDDINVDEVAKKVCLAIYGFSGQRCTAARRIIVFKKIKERFIKALLSEIALLRLGDPLSLNTDIGPIISREKCKQLEALCKKEIGLGKILCGGKISNKFSQGNWFEPTLILNPCLDSLIFTEETFGPIGLINEVRNIKEAVEISNAVRQGLIGSIFSDNNKHQKYFLEHAYAGMLVVNNAPIIINPALPFCGAKSSGYGIPEHGIFYRFFYTQPQTTYLS